MCVCVCVHVSNDIDQFVCEQVERNRRNWKESITGGDLFHFICVCGGWGVGWGGVIRQTEPNKTTHSSDFVAALSIIRQC